MSVGAGWEATEAALGAWRRPTSPDWSPEPPLGRGARDPHSDPIPVGEWPECRHDADCGRYCGTDGRCIRCGKPEAAA